MEPQTLFVQRETDPGDPNFGKVKGVYRQRQEGYAEEELSADHGDVADFHTRVNAILAANAIRAN